MLWPVLRVMRVSHTQMRDVLKFAPIFLSFLRAMRANAGYFAGYAR